LVLIVAPYGTGKTKYLLHWVQNRKATSRTAAWWFEIEAGDKHPIQFLYWLLSELIDWDHSILDHMDITLVEVHSLQANVSPEFKSDP